MRSMQVEHPETTLRLITASDSIALECGVTPDDLRRQLDTDERAIIAASLEDVRADLVLLEHDFDVLPEQVRRRLLRARMLFRRLTLDGGGMGSAGALDDYRSVIDAVALYCEMQPQPAPPPAPRRGRKKSDA